MMSWQPIETATKDDSECTRIMAVLRGEITIVYWDPYYAEGGNGHFPGRSAWVDSEGMTGDDPTHWMPLPELP